MLPDGVSLDRMRPDEVPVRVAWATAEGWNPGTGDLDLAYRLDPDAFLALRRGDELIGTGSIFSYDGAFGFMGCFIVREDLRGDGLGTELWHARRDRMVARLRPGASAWWSDCSEPCSPASRASRCRSTCRSRTPPAWDWWPASA